MWLCRPGQLGQPSTAWAGPANVCEVFASLIARSDVGRAGKNLLEAGGVIALLVLLYLLSLLAFLLSQIVFVVRLCLVPGHPTPPHYVSLTVWQVIRDNVSCVLTVLRYSELTSNPVWCWNITQLCIQDTNRIFQALCTKCLGPIFQLDKKPSQNTHFVHSPDSQLTASGYLHCLPSLSEKSDKTSRQERILAKHTLCRKWQTLLENMTKNVQLKLIFIGSRIIIIDIFQLHTRREFVWRKYQTYFFLILYFYIRIF